MDFITGEHGPELARLASGGIVAGQGAGDDTVPGLLGYAHEFAPFPAARMPGEDYLPRFAPTWDILVATIPHRHARLLGLLGALGAQMMPGVSVICYRDNLQAAYGDKCQALLEASAADYVSFADDDDMVAGDFIPRIMAALPGRPDYVGFPVAFTVNGDPQARVEHSLRHAGWGAGDAGMLTRDIVHFNPIRRELAGLGRWEGGYGADARWAAQVRETARVRTEAWIDDPMYFYRYDSADNSAITREPMAHPLPDLPALPWLRAL